MSAPAAGPRKLGTGGGGVGLSKPPSHPQHQPVQQQREICPCYLTGYCADGANCPLLHATMIPGLELKSAPTRSSPKHHGAAGGGQGYIPVCRDFAMGRDCPRGSMCPFSHDEATLLRQLGLGPGQGSLVLRPAGSPNSPSPPANLGGAAAARPRSTTLGVRSPQQVSSPTAPRFRDPRSLFPVVPYRPPSYNARGSTTPPPAQVLEAEGSPDRSEASSSSPYSPVTPASSAVQGEDEALTSCAVCLEDYEIGVELILFPCAHKFHVTCAMDWFRRKTTCPACDVDVFVAAEEQERALLTGETVNVANLTRKAQTPPPPSATAQPFASRLSHQAPSPAVRGPASMPSPQSSQRAHTTATAASSNATAPRLSGASAAERSGPGANQSQQQSQPRPPAPIKKKKCVIM
jgi:hypothetical protein